MKTFAKSRSAGVKSTCRNTLAVGCESPLARGMSRNTARSAAFSIPATSFGGSDGMAQAMPATPRVPRSLTPIRAAAPCESGTAVVYQAQLGLSMSVNLRAPCAKCGGNDFLAGGACSPCKKSYLAAYRAANREKARASAAAWRAANPARASASAESYRLANPEKIKARSASYYADNKEKLYEKLVAWKANNPDKVADYSAANYKANAKKINAYKAARYAASPDAQKARIAEWCAKNPEARRIHTQNRQARKREAGGSLSVGIAEKLLKLQKGLCPCCAQPLGDNYHLDHIVPLALGGSNTDDNIQLLRQRCNNQKHAKHPVDFMQSRGFLL